MVCSPLRLVFFATLVMQVGWLKAEAPAVQVVDGTSGLVPEATSSSGTSPFTSVGGGVEVDLKAKVVRMPIELVGKGNEKDPSRSLGLEFLVTIGKDKDYESMFASSSRGQNLHMALLMIGIVPASSDQNIPASSNLHVDIQLGKTRSPAKDWVRWSDLKKVEDLDWHFRGSKIITEGERKLYAADEALNLVACLPSPTMVVGPGAKVGNPYNEEEVYLVPAILPDVSLGTEGWIWFRAR